MPDWTPDQGGPEGWAQEVACVAWEGEGTLVLVDPLVDEGDWGALDALVKRHGEPVAVVVTCPWHVRSAGEAVERYVNSPGIEVWAHYRRGEGHGAHRLRRGERGLRERAGLPRAST